MEQASGRKTLGHWCAWLCRCAALRLAQYLIHKHLVGHHMKQENGQPLTRDDVVVGLLHQQEVGLLYDSLDCLDPLTWSKRAAQLLSLFLKIRMRLTYAFVDHLLELPGQCLPWWHFLKNFSHMRTNAHFFTCFSPALSLLCFYCLLISWRIQSLYWLEMTLRCLQTEIRYGLLPTCNALPLPIQQVSWVLFWHKLKGWKWGEQRNRKPIKYYTHLGGALAEEHS